MSSAIHNVNFMGPVTEPTIMLGHGLGTDQSFWSPVADQLSATHRLCLFDQAGAGQAAAPARESRGLGDYARDLAGLVADLGVTRPHYVGHSAGGMIGLLAAVEQPEMFASLTLICASPCYLSQPGYHGGFEAEDIEAYLNLIEQNFMGWALPFAETAAKNDDIARLLVTSFQAWSRPALGRFARQIVLGDYRAVLQNVRTPTLLIHTDQDDIVPLQVATFMHGQIQQSQLQVIAAPGHCPHLSHPALVADQVREHVASH